MLLLNNRIILLVQNYGMKLVLLSSLLLSLSLFLSIPNIRKIFPEMWSYNVTQNYHNQRCCYYYYYEYQYYR